MAKNNKIIMGRFASTHGVHGWIKVVSFTDPTENLLAYPHWEIQHHGEWQTMTVTAGKVHGKFLIVKLEGLEDPETAQRYTNDKIAIQRTALAPLSNGEYYWADLIGLQVINLAGVKLGSIDSLIETGANDVLVVKENQREILIPYTSTVIKSVDLKEKKIIVDWEADF